MATTPLTWIVVMDSAQARLLETTDGERFELVDEMASEVAHMRTHDLVSDRPGRGHESAASAHHAIEGRHDAHELAKQNFVRSVADRLGKAAQDAKYERLVLVAPKRQLGELRRSLPAIAHAKRSAELAKDLVKLPTAKLQLRLAQLLPPR